jgi:uncharacterized damage-inducible protein DinB
MKNADVMMDMKTTDKMIEMPSPKEMFLKAWDMEFQTTMKVLMAYPEHRQDYRPHEKSRSALELAWTFVVEERAGIAGAMNGKLDFQNIAQPPKTYKEALSELEKTHKQNVERLKKMSDEDLQSLMKWYTGPKQSMDMPKINVMWFMLMDAIHHRGQFSVYLRMAGGKVPSIYGPTADEPWN